MSAKYPRSPSGSKPEPSPQQSPKGPRPNTPVEYTLEMPVALARRRRRHHRAAPHPWLVRDWDDQASAKMLLACLIPLTPLFFILAFLALAG